MAQGARGQRRRLPPPVITEDQPAESPRGPPESPPLTPPVIMDSRWLWLRETERDTVKAAEARLNQKSTDPFDPTKVIDATLDSFPFFEFFPDKKDRLQKTLAGGGGQ